MPEQPPPSGSAPPSSTAGLGGLRLDELLKEVQERLAEIVKTRDRLQSLLDAVLAVGAGLELDSTLRRIVQAAVDLVDARYGALGVLGPNESLSELVYVGIDSDERARMGHLSRTRAARAVDRATDPAPRARPTPGVGGVPAQPSADEQLPRGARAGA